MHSSWFDAQLDQKILDGIYSGRLLPNNQPHIVYRNKSATTLESTTELRLLKPRMDKSSTGTASMDPAGAPGGPIYTRT